MDEYKKLKGIRDLIDGILRGSDKPEQVEVSAEISGAFLDEEDQKIYLVERLSSGEEFLIPSTDGVNFDAGEKIAVEEYKKDHYFFDPVRLRDWNHPARNHVDSRDGQFDHAYLTILGEFDSPNGRLVLYDCSYIVPGHQRLTGGGFVVDANDKDNINWRSDEPLWDEFMKDDEIKYIPIGVVYFQEKFHIYYYSGNRVYIIKIKDPFQKLDVPETARTVIKKHPNNPILEATDNHWESMAAFNPAVVQIDDKVHMFYRAQGPDHLSVVGYGCSTDGVNFERSKYPVYIPDERFQKVVKGDMKPDPQRVSGYGWGGCEDPRATMIDDTMYLIYVAFDGWSEPRLAMSKISKEDIVNQNWDGWSDPQFMTPFSNVWGTGNKSGVLFPRTINGKYVILHRLWPNICVDFVDDLDFGDNKKYLQTRAKIKVRKDHWDSLKIGAGAPPIEVDEGWLLIYFGVGYQDRSKYKIGAMILDKDDPTKVLYRSSTPLIAPDEWYENHGKPGVTYPCGAVVRDGKLTIYYGGADIVVCAAECDVRELVNELKNDNVEPNLLKSAYVHS